MLFRNWSIYLGLLLALSLVIGMFQSIPGGKGISGRTYGPTIVYPAASRHTGMYLLVLRATLFNPKFLAPFLYR